MQQSIKSSNSTPTCYFFGKKKEEDVDKGTTRKTPGDSGGARPPKKEDFNEIERENDREKDVQEETVDNEERDKNKR
ncbi:hypothetical protein SAMN04489724_2925 [Algoriphagus locisalis]|uniref:Uncharacterized protein n=1 Tax=Algoriphagus locisalis TaxID=305507 RepID=A0A1I7C749_9BACT|nr:hypothetical protein [Algoriphagus locisalis]SFT95253.1 hypothetical protein SAMN04489724_2925 [Algoriphagus locisalis]